jgi:hypothetical protein
LGGPYRTQSGSAANAFSTRLKKADRLKLNF